MAVDNREGLQGSSTYCDDCKRPVSECGPLQADMTGRWRYCSDCWQERLDAEVTG